LGCRELTQIGVVAVDWDKLFAASPAMARVSLFRDLARDATPSPADGHVIAGLLAAPEAGRLAVLEAYLCTEVGAVLQLDPSKVARDQPLTVMGFDSLLALELRQRVERDLEVTVPIVNLFRGDSVGEFAAYLHAEIRKKHPEAFGAAPALDAAQLLAQVDVLTDEAVDALLENVIAEAAETERKAWT
jgi:phthiocerol/phenolphthiocerol synthesis type-I polyketide synthase D